MTPAFSEKSSGDFHSIQFIHKFASRRAFIYLANDSISSLIQFNVNKLK